MNKRFTFLFTLLFLSLTAIYAQDDAPQKVDGPVTPTEVKPVEEVGEAATLLDDAPVAIEEIDTIYSQIEWDMLEYDLGDVAVGKEATHTFHFNSVGQDTLLVTGVTSSCGCTVASYTESPVPIGESGTVTASIKPKEAGPFTQYLTVISNTKEFVHILQIHGTAFPVAEEEPAEEPSH